MHGATVMILGKRLEAREIRARARARVRVNVFIRVRIWVRVTL
jgi:hypothetical protein